jgi:hypothetical protein
MKNIRSLILVAIVLSAPAYGLAQANVQERRDLYRRCTLPMRTDPQTAYEVCKEYLKKYSDDEQRLVKFVSDWTTAYEQVLPYLTYLRSISTPNPASSWFIYEPDLSIEIPQVTQRERSNPVEIVRRFKDEREEGMLRRAEAVYPGVDSMVAKVAGGPAFFAQFAPLGNEPLWWDSAHSSIRETYAVTSRAVRYYYDLSQELRTDPQRVIPGWGKWQTSLKYLATINYHNQYERGEKKFRDVYVADLNLEWSQVCGGLCGAGYKRNKVVVLDQSGNVLAMFLDAPENRGGWVS